MNEIIAKMQAQVGPQAGLDGQLIAPRAGDQGELVVSKLHGKYYEVNRRGNLYMAVTAVAGIVPLKYDSVNPALVLWNQSQNLSLVLGKLTLSHIGTPAVSGNLGFAVINAGVAIGTPISAFTEVDVRNMKTLAPGKAPAGKVGTTVTAAAPAAASFVPIGFSSPGVLAAASTTTPWAHLEKDFDGEWSVPPGYALALCGNVAQTAAFGVTLSWYEIGAK